VCREAEKYREKYVAADKTPLVYPWMNEPGRGAVAAEVGNLTPPPPSCGSSPVESSTCTPAVPRLGLVQATPCRGRISGIVALGELRVAFYLYFFVLPVGKAAILLPLARSARQVKYALQS